MAVRGIIAACTLAGLGTAGAATPAWDWQLSPPFDLSGSVDVLDIDPDHVTRAQVAELKARGTYLICYISTGTWEDWRSDRAAFPDEVLGKTYADWPDERFLDIRRRDLLLPIMMNRFRVCADMGFDAVEPDNMGTHDNDTGFDMTRADTLSYVRALAGIAHGLGLQIGQKNATRLVPDLVAEMDFMIVESCMEDGWCDATLPYIAAGKPVYAAEYNPASLPAACAWGAEHSVPVILKDKDLHAGVTRCP